MAKILEYDFERPWWLNPVVNGIGGGMASGGGGYIATGDPQTSGIVAVIGSIVTGGVTYALTRDRVFDKSGYGNTGFARNGAHIRDGRLVLPGKDEYVEVPNSPSLNPDSSDWTVKVSLNASKTQNEAFLWPLVKPRAEKRPAYYIIGTPDWPSVAFGVRDGEENKAEVRVEIPTQRDTDIGFVWDHPEIRVFVDGGVVASDRNPNVGRVASDMPLFIGSDGVERTRRRAIEADVRSVEVWNEAKPKVL